MNLATLYVKDVLTMLFNVFNNLRTQYNRCTKLTKIILTF